MWRGVWWFGFFLSPQYYSHFKNLYVYAYQFPYVPAVYWSMSACGFCQQQLCNLLYSRDWRQAIHNLHPPEHGVCIALLQHSTVDEPWQQTRQRSLSHLRWTLPNLRCRMQQAQLRLLPGVCWSMPAMRWRVPQARAYCTTSLVVAGALVA